ncbi:recombinase family protein [Nocardia yunnanensis]|uniref:Recombinase family protein n=1 Tax=Nocardia yunnanensis TaxID=2382165 RepID=A0A386ZHY2_9NOCA|nr:recombinase family protein [Nocardia yunnanensis]AYF77157.1 recombinase family protein [Nocardia yunnanensis]
MNSGLRALVGARVSVVQGPEKVSNFAQLETGMRWADANGLSVVAMFQDLDVSAGKYTPFERPDLGKWLTEEKLWEWDVLIFSKIDRMFRSTHDCVEFAKWCKEHRKILVFADDNLTLNYRDAGKLNSLDQMMTELFIYIGSFFAQIELNRYRSRAEDFHRVLRTTDRWASGVPPFGFQTVDHPSGKGKTLARDPYGYEWLYKIAEKLLAGWSWIRIAAWLNESKVLTNMDRAMIKNGKESKERPWNVGTVKLIMTSWSTQGYKTTDKGKKPHLDADGNMVRIAEPTFDDATWEQIQQAAAKRSYNGTRRVHSENPMLGVGSCGLCGAQLAQQISARRGKSTIGLPDNRYYRCGRTPLNCNGMNISAEEAERTLESQFLAEHGEKLVIEKVFVPGSDNSRELEEVTGAIARLRAESDAGLIETQEDQDHYISRLKGLTARKRELEKDTVRPSKWEEKKLDITYGEAWARSVDPIEHREMLRKWGVRLILQPKSSVPRVILEFSK